MTYNLFGNYSLCLRIRNLLMNTLIGIREIRWRWNSFIIFQEFWSRVLLWQNPGQKVDKYVLYILLSWDAGTRGGRDGGSGGAGEGPHAPPHILANQKTAVAAGALLLATPDFQTSLHPWMPLAPPIFGRSVNPIQTGGRANYAQQLLLVPPIFDRDFTSWS